MKELISGEFAPSGVCVYTAYDLTTYHGFTPLLINRLGRPEERGGNRLILAAPLLEGADISPLPSKLRHEGLRPVDWPSPAFSSRD